VTNIDGSQGTRPIAFVTGASRGIGRATAVALAMSGFDVVITARTVKDGERREHSSTIKHSDTRPMPGSLEATAAEIVEAGGRALVVAADLLDGASLVAAAERAIGEWGGVDVLVHNGRYIGPGNMDRFLETPVETFERQLTANVMGPIILTHELLPSMLRRGHANFVGITSAVAYGDPTEPAGSGGWGMGYGISKGAFHRIAGFLAVEHAQDGLRCFNVQPGMIDTERGGMDDGRHGFGGWGAPPEVVGLVVAWLVTDPRGAAYAGTTVEAQYLCHELGLLPEWNGPLPARASIRYDEAPSRLRDLEERFDRT